MTWRKRATRGRIGPWLIGLAALLALALSIAVSITLGPVPIGVGDVLHVVTHHVGLTGPPEVSRIAAATVWELRLPRALLAALCGTGLAVCGLVLQALLRNPLADPYLLGVSSGASTGAVVMVVFAPATLLGSPAGLSAGAFAGAVLAFVVVMALAHLAGGGNHRIILAGVAVTQLFSALTSFLIMVAADANTTRGVLFWLLGSLASSTWDDVAVAGAVVIVGVLVALFQATALNAFTFGAEQASTLGIDVRRVRIVLLGVTAALTATVVSQSGAIGFVGLVLPHLTRLLVGVSHRRLIPATAMLGGIFLVWVDTAGRTVAAPTDIPVGVITALIGVPIFAALLLRNRSVTS